MTDELWMVRGGEPVLWTMPVRVTWEKEVAKFFPILNLPTKVQEYALAHRLTQAGAYYVSGIWEMPRSKLLLVAQEMPPETDPEHCYSWERRRSIAQYVSGRHDRGEFVDALFQKGIGSSRSECVFWWNQICNHMLDWLVNEERPVDLYFLRLVPCPLRFDWIARTFKRVGTRAPKTRALILALLANPKMDPTKHLLRGGMTSYQGKGICERHVELQHTELWWKVSKKVELERARLLGVCGYAEEFIASQKRFVKTGIELFREWCFRSLNQCSLIRQGGHKGARCFVAYTRMGSLRNSVTISNCRDAAAVLLSTGRRGKSLYRRKKKRMLRLRYLRRRGRDVRDRWRNVGKPGTKQPRRIIPPGMLVLSSVQTAPKSQLLACGRNRREIGMEPGIKFIS